MSCQLTKLINLLAKGSDCNFFTSNCLLENFTAQRKLNTFRKVNKKRWNENCATSASNMTMWPTKYSLKFYRRFKVLIRDKFSFKMVQNKYITNFDHSERNSVSLLATSSFLPLLLSSQPTEIVSKFLNWPHTNKVLLSVHKSVCCYSANVTWMDAFLGHNDIFKLNLKVCRKQIMSRKAWSEIYLCNSLCAITFFRLGWV